MKQNSERMKEIERRERANIGPQKFVLGQQVVRRDGNVGVIEAVYVDLDAAMNAFIIREGWYERQTVNPPRTGKTGRWYSVLLSDGQTLDGELDLRELPS